MKAEETDWYEQTRQVARWTSPGVMLHLFLRAETLTRPYNEAVTKFTTRPQRTKVLTWSATKQGNRSIKRKIHDQKGQRRRHSASCKREGEDASATGIEGGALAGDVPLLGSA